MIINGSEIAKKIRTEIKQKVEKLDEKPGLAVVLAGDDPASEIYVKYKEKACEEIGIYSEKHVLKKEITMNEVLDIIERLNNDEKIHGILVQLPLYDHLDEYRIIDAIYPKKDVDGFHPINVGNLLIGKESIIPCTPKGIIRLIKSTGEKIEGKNAVVVGRSNIVGKPVSVLLLRENATVTICHSRTKNLKEHTKNADILVCAVGIAKFIKKDMVKKGSIIIDVGMNRVEGKLYGDIDFENIKDKTSWITPVPKGVGPMTIAMLMQNTLECYEKT
ncbi:bifunctional methylenetetrahydrofolate dehydrogenase/methenyltetrahydrofolate cyclohydrolase FolD [Candidatus Woesearchaeota archaeon]|nr:bifunctional methylenetetrahydrofolate dehydrogenase/methenyltetrahydrofolate cyclohydrolase FolD [Candidatus Woesearchaeota archaeon]